LRVLAAILKRDFRRTVRSPLTTILLLILPLAMGTLIAFAFGEGPPRVRLLVSNADESFGGSLLEEGLARMPSDRFEVTRVDSAEGRSRLADGEGSALVHIPAGFFADVLDREEATLSVWKNSRESIMPQVVEEGALILADGLSAAATLFEEPVREIRDMVRLEEDPPEDRVVAVSLLFHRAMDRSGRFLFPPAVGVETEEAEGSGGASPGRVFLFVLPGLAVMALLYIADQTMRDLLHEMASGTLALSLTAPITPSLLVAGKILATVALGLVSLALLVPFGLPFLESEIDIPSFLAVSVAFCLAAGGFAAITYGLAKNERQGGLVGNVVMLVMAFIGGSYIPLSALPAGVRALSPFTLNFWAVDGYIKVVQAGAGLGAIAPNLGVLLAIAVVLTLAGGGLLRARIGRGLQ
jgi:ABC-2 type transport system permease protein